MTPVDKTITTEELSLLRSLVGQRVLSFEASPIGGTTYYEKVRLSCDGASIVISNTFEPMDVGYIAGCGKENVGLIRVENDKGALVLSDVENGPENATIEVGSRIISVEVVNDRITIRKGDNVTNSFAWTQAIILHLEDGDLVIDRNIWFEVFLDVFVTADSQRSLRNTCADWAVGSDEDGYDAIVDREFVTVDN